MASLRCRQCATIDTGIERKEIARDNNRRHSDLAGQTGAQIMRGQTQLARMCGQTLTRIQRMLDRVRCGECLRAEQQDSQQQMGKVFFQGVLQSTWTNRPLRYSPSGKAKSTGWSAAPCRR